MAPPHISSDAALRSTCAVAGPAFRMSYVRMRVASRLWCASRLGRTKDQHNLYLHLHSSPSEMDSFGMEGVQRATWDCRTSEKAGCRAC